MAHTCFIRILAMYATGAQAQKTTEKLGRLAEAAEETKEGIDAGGLCIFELEAYGLLNGVVLEGWVKWGIDDPHALALVGFLKSQADLMAAFIECCTPDSEFYGEISWTGGRLTSRELPCERWPEGWQYGEDAAAINEALAAYGVEREIKVETAE